MDFHKWKKKNATAKADYRNPWMGLNGVVCEKPAYWCRLHEVWMSEEDVEKKKCLAKMTYNMLGYRKCNNIEKRDNPFIFDGKNRRPCSEPSGELEEE